MTTVACVFVRGHVNFTTEYVVRLQAMVRRWMDRPYRFVCLTDKARGIPGIETIAIQSPSPLYGWWSKVQLFAPHSKLAGRVLYLDLDTLIVRSLAPILDFPAPFALVPDGAPDWKPKNGQRQTVKRFNSSVMVWNAGEQERLYRDWTPSVAGRLWGDQCWIGEQAPDAGTMPAAWFPRLSEVTDGPTPEAKVILSKVPKNVQAAKKYPWFADIWRAA